MTIPSACDRSQRRTANQCNVLVFCRVIARGLMLMSFVLSPAALFSQTCAFDECFARPDALRRADLLDAVAADFRKNAPPDALSSEFVYRIPVVVHVVYISGLENITREQIQSQIDVLNEDYRRKINTPGYGKGFDTRIEFFLARRDPGGRPCDGIVRVKSPLTELNFTDHAQLTRLSHWDSDRYLNVYIVHTITPLISGYATFPLGAAEEDGIVVRHALFGRTGTGDRPGVEGRICTHEVGHWLGLYHTFHDGCGQDPCNDGDRVCDTPPAANPHLNCGEHDNSCHNDFPDLDDQLENYMDYLPDECKNVFTPGQIKRMHAVLSQVRTTIWSEDNLRRCGYYDAAVDEFVPHAALQADVRQVCPGLPVCLTVVEHNTVDAVHWRIDGAEPATSTDFTPCFTFPREGLHDVELAVYNQQGADTLRLTDFIAVQPPTAQQALPFNADFNNIDEIPADFGLEPRTGRYRWLHHAFDHGADHRECIWLNNYNAQFGSVASFVLPAFDFDASAAHAELSFDCANASSFEDLSDTLFVEYSTDCGLTWSILTQMTGPEIWTAAASTMSFLPGAAEWRRHKMSLNILAGSRAVQLRVRCIAGGANNLFIDNIAIESPQLTDVKQQRIASDVDLRVFPNPATDILYLETRTASALPADLRICDLTGRELMHRLLTPDAAGRLFTALSTDQLAAGLVILRLEVDGRVFYRVIEIQSL